MKRKIFSGVILASLIATPLYAKDLFNLTATIPGETASVSFNNVSDIVKAVDNQSLHTLLTLYTPISAASITIDLRGLPTTVTYAANSTTLVFNVPSLNINKQFTGSTRDESQTLFEDYLKKNGNGIFTKILQKLAASTAIDPTAGNPNSLMAKMGSSDFGAGTDFGGGQMGRTQPSKNTLDILTLRFGSYSAGPYTQNVYTWPINYTYRFDSDSRKQLIFDIPLTYTDTEGGKSYSTSLGIGFRYPVNNDWTLTPMVRIGGAGSVDLGSAAVIYSGSLVSNYNLYWGDTKISIGNMIAEFKADSLDIGGYSVGYNLTNTMLKNGIGFAVPLNFKMFGKPTSLELDIVHTDFFGDALYINRYFDFAMSFGTHGTESALDNFRVGLTYTVGNNSYNGVMFNLGYTF